MFSFIFKKLKELFNELIKLTSYNKPLTIFILLFVIITVVYIYYTQIKPLSVTSYKPNKEFVGHVDKYSKQVDLYYFYTTWCPYCKKSRPEWEATKQEYKVKKVNGYTINFIEIDCDEDSVTADKFDIEGYPSIKLVKGKQIIEYNAKVDRVSLDLFLKEMIQAD
tara:strand:+ start:302 stop:796 length:495 start_codon:yes stop_codon:yes gene_type:complete